MGLDAKAYARADVAVTLFSVSTRLPPGREQDRDAMLVPDKVFDQAFYPVFVTPLESP